MNDVTFRSGTPDDIAALQRIEWDAGQMFRTVDMVAIADDAPPSAETFLKAILGESLFVAEANGGPVAYIMTRRLTDSVHIDQITVHPQFQRRGIATDLMDIVTRTGVPLTLTTFRDVPWNAPAYARIGFDVVQMEDVPDDLRQIVDDEIAHGLHRWARVVMRRSGGG